MSTVVRQGVFVGFPNRDWQAVTHPQLLKAVESVREHFAEKAEDLRETILKDVSKGPEMLKSKEGFEEWLFRTNWRAPRCIYSRDRGIAQQ